MKKFLALFVFAILSTISVMAQSDNLVATLTHEGETTQFYGQEAISKALEAAVDGDVIALSAGNFTGCSITKNITLRGVGVEEAVPTKITGNFNLQIPSSAKSRLVFEGIDCTSTITVKSTVNQPMFLKSNFYAITGSEGTFKNATFINCFVSDYIYTYNQSNLTFINCKIQSPNNYSSQNAKMSYINCIVRTEPSYLDGCSLINSIFINSLSSNSTSRYLPSTAVLKNCVITGYQSSYNLDTTSKTPLLENTSIVSLSSVFDTYTSSSNYLSSDDFKLTETAKEKYLGDDNTQIGLYGGSYPYSMTPTYPRISSLKVDSRASADGKLNVEVSISE